MFFRIGILKNFAMFTGKHFRWSLFLIKLQAFRPSTLLKRDSNIGISCEICDTFKKTFFYRIHPVAGSRNISWTLSLLHIRRINGVISWYVWLSSAYFILARVFRFFLFLSFFLISFEDFTTCWGIEVSL